jgi:hypothetical protein
MTKLNHFIIFVLIMAMLFVINRFGFSQIATYPTFFIQNYLTPTTYPVSSGQSVTLLKFGIEPDMVNNCPDPEYYHLTFKASGTGNEMTDIAAINVWQATDGYDNTPNFQLFQGPFTFSVDDGQFQVSWSVWGGRCAFEDYIVTYTFSPNPIAGTYRLDLIDVSSENMVLNVSPPYEGYTYDTSLPVFTPSSTETSTCSPTPTITSMPMTTPTPTTTQTLTVAETSTATMTTTMTITSTFTSDFTPTVIFANTSTLTPTWTFTATSSPTATSVWTETETQTPLTTPTPTSEIVGNVDAKSLVSVVSYPNPSTDGTANLSYDVAGTTADASQAIANSSSRSRGTYDPQASVVLRIFTRSGRLLWTYKVQGVKIGANSYHWNGHDFKNAPLANGLYLYTATLEKNGSTQTKTSAIYIIK